MRLYLAFIGLGFAAGSQALAAPPCPPGFAQLQNSSTCVRVSGRVRADAVLGSSHQRSSEKSVMRATGEVRLDVRKPTEYGPLRAVIGVKGISR